MSGAGALVRGGVVLLMCALSLGLAREVRADGEVGLVVEENGQVRTFCVPYTGDSISGDELLSRAGLPYEDVGTGAGAVLCAIEEIGCFDAHDFNSCWCECEGGGSNCTYWAFFTRDYGSGWVYSARAFDRVEATDGDLHAWKWGVGGPSSAPRPSDSLTFESVCGHAPMGGTASQPTATQPGPPPGQATRQPATPTEVASPTAAGSETPFTSVPETAAGSPDVSVTLTVDPPATDDGAASPRELEEDGDGGSGVGALIGFGAVALALVAAIGVAISWRRTHGG